MSDLGAQHAQFGGKRMVVVVAGQLFVLVALGVQPLRQAAQAVLFGEDACGSELPAHADRGHPSIVVES
ncbi:hypothetical protein [Streptomyces sp. NPDC001640]